MGQDFVAYLDDSGHPSSREMVVVAGLLASQRQWSLLEIEWKAALQHVGLCYLHLADFEAGHNDYRQLSQPDSERLPIKLAGIIRARVRHSYCFMVPMDDYRKVNQEWALEECIGTPYALAGGNVIKELTTWRDRHREDCNNLVITLDQGSLHKGDLMECMARDRVPLSGEAFADKRKIVSLQAADMLAWECYHSFETKTIRYSLGILLEIPFEHGVFTREDLEDACRDSYAMRRCDLPPDTPILFTSALKRPRKRTIL